MNHDLSRMYIFGDEGHELKLMSLEQARESVQVFEGQLTCCRREHVGMKMCDREKLVGPILGLYGTAYAKHIRQKSVAADSSASFGRTEIELDSAGAAASSAQIIGARVTIVVPARVEGSHD